MKLANKHFFNARHEYKAVWLPVLVALLLLTLLMVFLQSLGQREHDNLHNKSKAEAKYLCAAVHTDLRVRVLALRRSARRWETRGGMQEEEFAGDMVAYLADNPGFQAVEWIDKDFFARWIVPLEGNERAKNLNLAFEPKRRAALEKARTTESPTMTAPIELVQGGQGFLVYFPLFIRNQFEGFILAVFRAQDWLDYVYESATDKTEISEATDFSVSVFIDGVPAYESTLADTHRDEQLIGDANTTFMGHRFSVYTYPTKAFIHRERSMLPVVVALFGFLFSILMAIVVYLFQKVYRTKIKLADKTVLQEVQFETSLDGILTVDVDGGVLSCNQRFGEIWRIPQHILSERDDSRMLNYALTQLKHPEEFKGKVGYLYEHRTESSRDEIEFLDGRCFDRYSSPLLRKDGEYIGRIWSFRDITNRKVAELALKRSETQIRLLLNSTAEGIYGIDRQGICTFANPACLRLLGYSDISELLGRNMHTLIHHSCEDGSSMAVQSCKIFRAFREGKGMTCDDEVFWRADGTCFPVEYWSYPQLEGGVTAGAVVTFIDITERKKIERALRKSESRYSQLVEQSRTVIWEVDADGLYTYFSKTAEEILGYHAEDIVGNIHFYDLHPEEGRTEFRKAAFEVFARKESFVGLENAVEAKDGSIVWVSTNGIPVLGEGGVLLGYRGSDTDITERKRVQDMLLVERRRLADILEGTNVGTWEWNVQTGQTVFNERWAEMLGYSLAELAPISVETWDRLMHPDDLKHVNELLEKHFRKEIAYYEGESRLRHKDGRWLWVLDRGKVSTWSDDGRPLVMCGTHQDINDRKMAEVQISHMATHDGLTDLPTMRLADDRITMAISQARRDKTMVAVMFIDLDGFKTVNDSLGHDAGDCVLKQVAQSLRSHVREQ